MAESYILDFWNELFVELVAEVVILVVVLVFGQRYRKRPIYLPAPGTLQPQAT